MTRNEEDRPRRRSPHTITLQLAQQLAEWYLEEVRLFRKQARRARPSAALLTSCEQMAEWLASRNIGDAREFMHFQFGRLMERRGVPPMLKQCYGPRALVAWRRREESVESRAERAALSLNFERQQYHQALATARQLQETMQWDDDEIYRYAMLDPTNQLSPLFRFCQATHEMRLDLASAWQDAALRQYASDTDSYDQTWGNFIPPGLRSAVMNFRAAAS